jgi:hypothetical protein
MRRLVPVSDRARVQTIRMRPDWLQELRETLEASGLEPEFESPLEERGAAQVIETIVTVYVLGTSAALQTQKIVAGLSSWARRVFRERRVEARRLGMLYGPDGEVLAEVAMPEVED